MSNCVFFFLFSIWDNIFRVIGNENEHGKMNEVKGGK